MMIDNSFLWTYLYVAPAGTWEDSNDTQPIQTNSGVGTLAETLAAIGEHFDGDQTWWGHYCPAIEEHFANSLNNDYNVDDHSAGQWAVITKLGIGQGFNAEHSI